MDDTKWDFCYGCGKRLPLHLLHICAKCGHRGALCKGCLADYHRCVSGHEHIHSSTPKLRSDVELAKLCRELMQDEAIAVYIAGSQIGCECDASVGMVPCQGCAEQGMARRVLAIIEFLQGKKATRPAKGRE